MSSQTKDRPSLRTHAKRKSFSALSQAAAQSNRPGHARRASVAAAVGLAGAQKAQRTSKTSQKLVVLPSAPQTKPLPHKLDEDALGEEEDEDLELGYETDAGVKVKDYKSPGERMSKAQRKKAGFKRITAYCVAESLKMKLLAGYLRREHNVMPRIYDEALYAIYHMPLLPGYGPNSNIRSSAPAEVHEGRKRRMSEAEDLGYQGAYFNSEEAPMLDPQGYIPSSSPLNSRPSGIARERAPGDTTDLETDATVPVSASLPDEHMLAQVAAAAVGSPTQQPTSPATAAAYDVASPVSEDEPVPMSATVAHAQPPKIRDFLKSPFKEERDYGAQTEDSAAEAVFFDYGVVVFFGFTEGQERSILEDLENADILRRRVEEDDWEIEECHYVHDVNIKYPRIYNDFFTLRSHSHLLKLSIAHALAQSTLLAHYETNAQKVLSAPETVAIPRQLAKSGKLKLRRREALRLTGRLFKLRRNINLVSNVLDVPELFWSEATLKDLYDAVREYMEIDRRVQALNEKLSVASELLDAIHDHINTSAMERITWIIIWLIVAACVVEMGEVLARLIVHATTAGSGRETAMVAINATLPRLSREEALQTLERMMVVQS